MNNKGHPPQIKFSRRPAYIVLLLCIVFVVVWLEEDLKIAVMVLASFVLALSALSFLWRLPYVIKQRAKWDQKLYLWLAVSVIILTTMIVMGYWQLVLLPVSASAIIFLANVYKQFK